MKINYHFIFLSGVAFVLENKWPKNYVKVVGVR